MLAQHVIVATQSTEVHDATDTGLGCGLGEVRRIAVLTVRPPLALPDGVDQIDGDVHTGHRRRELTADVSLDHLGRGPPGCSIELGGRPGQAADLEVLSQEHRDQPTADVPGAPVTSTRDHRAVIPGRLFEGPDLGVRCAFGPITSAYGPSACAGSGGIRPMPLPYELAIPTIGAFSGAPPMEPSNWASPKEKIPPSVATIRYPAPSGVAAMPAIGAFKA